MLRSVAAVGLALGCTAPPAATRPASPTTLSAPPTPSPSDAPPAAVVGCGKPPGKVGERELLIDGRPARLIVSIPGTYDGNRRYPLVFAFHGRNRNHRNCQETDCAGVQSVMGEEAVLAYLQSVRDPLDREDGGWEWPTELEQNLRFFDAAWGTIQSEFCIDPGRVVVTGSSSGGTFANLLACQYGDRLLAVAPVSGGFMEPRGCRGAPAAIVIHGIDDSHVPIARGLLARDSYQQRAGCSSSTVPPLESMHATVRAARDAKPSIEAAACVDYQGCTPGKALRWCEHSFGGYDGSTHGWPPVGGQLIWDFIRSL